jgi:predicted negative regulator of RcsB-dependent stress response
MKAEVKSKIAEMKGKVKDGLWWLVSGAIIAMIIGFTWGGWATASATQKMSDEAVLASQAAICVAQFMKAPASQERLKELEGMDSWKRYEVIENGGWDKMPGQEKASHSVSRACVAGLEVLIKK